VKNRNKSEKLKWEFSKNDDNVDDDNDHGEEWMKNPPLYNKVWISSRKRRIKKYY